MKEFNSYFFILFIYTPKILSDWGATTSGCAGEYDRYLGVEELLPYAMSVSAKSNDFDSDGNCIETDF